MIEQDFHEAAPHNPGVYIFHGKAGQVIYVGKAADLHNRLADYARSQPGQKEYLIVSNAETVEWIIVANERQSLELEETLIKKYAPPYNVLLKDGKGYSYLRIDLNQTYPSVEIVRIRQRKSKPGQLLFGPFVPLRVPDLPGKIRGDLKNLMQIAEEVFGIRSCRGTLKNRTRPCVYYEIGRCSAPCVGAISPEEYRQRVEMFVRFLNGDTAQVESKVRQMMDEAVKNLNFERAIDLRDLLYTVRRIGMQREANVRGSADVMAFSLKDDIGAGFVVSVRDGMITNVFGLKYSSGSVVTLDEIIDSFFRDYVRVYHEENIVVYTPSDVASKLKEVALLHGVVVEMVPPEWDALLKVAQENAESLLERDEGNERIKRGLLRIEEELHLEHMPTRIEGFDMAQLFGSERVGGKVAYINGQFYTPWYRHYRIRGSYKDDFSFMYEVVLRRLQEQDTGLPDLMLIDGGKQHLNVVERAMDEVGIHVPAVAIAKPDDRFFVTWKDDPIILPPEDVGKQILQTIRNEAHRWVNSYHRKLREDFGDILLNVPGIGKVRRRNLIDTFGGMVGLQSASKDELIQKGGLPAKVAENLYRALHPDELG
ncbi:excinuclease ABC subunit UvrC [Coprothermobacter platensis]|uniref:excinuclease ABC subunit UvrC n=1 Tax=Coprothermobacter platensis TaxID=108819 RepID=UPI0003671131|nr:excinuclease ABC subunit UvrC [Coprothermobacter platensis]